MHPMVLFDAESGNELEDLPAISVWAAPRVGETVHIWVDNSPKPDDGSRWTFEVKRVFHDIRRMAADGQTTHIVCLYVKRTHYITA